MNGLQDGAFPASFLIHINSINSNMRLGHMSDIYGQRGRTRQSGAPGERRRNAGQERRPDRRSPSTGGTSLREVVTEIDRDILRLLLKRHNLIGKMRGSRPRLDPAEEKFLREAWQKAVAKVSRDADLSGRFFALMQDATFLPRPPARNAATPSILRRRASPSSFPSQRRSPAARRGRGSFLPPPRVRPCTSPRA